MQKRRLEPLDEGISSKSSREICDKEERRCACCRRGRYRRYRGAWTLEVLIELITEKDVVIRGAKVRTGRSTTERPVQFLYPMELSCDDTDERPKAVKLNPEAPEFRTRPKRDAPIAASLRIGDAVD